MLAAIHTITKAVKSYGSLVTKTINEAEISLERGTGGQCAKFEAIVRPDVP